jgi:KDO2-lipid IV(A) lauroyltransferase
VRERLEYALLWPWIKLLGILPRSLARTIGISLGLTVYAVHGRLRRVGFRNLTIAFPEMSQPDRRRIVRGEFISLGRQLAEVCLFPRYTKENVSRTVVYEGFENFERAYARGKGVLFLTGHIGAWELSAFAHSFQGHPLSIVMRSLDNPYVDALIQRYRTMHGNRTVDKDNFVRGLLSAMKAGETVGILMDTNMTPPQGEFVKFFGVEACTATGLAHIARKTGAAVLPGFMLWEPAERKYILHFGPEIEIPHTADASADILAGTQLCTSAIESWIRRYPDQWLWIHRRWKTRPAGEPGLY